MMKWIIFLGVLALATKGIMVIVGKVKSKEGYFGLVSIGILGIFYLAGEASQLLLIPIPIVRNWFSDIGFIPGWIFWMLLFFRGLQVKQNIKPKIVAWAFLLLVACIIHEVLQLQFDSQFPGRTQGLHGFSGRGDVIDIAAYVISFLVSMIFLAGIPKDTLLAYVTKEQVVNPGAVKLKKNRRTQKPA